MSVVILLGGMGGTRVAVALSFSAALLACFLLSVHESRIVRGPLSCDALEIRVDDNSTEVESRRASGGFLDVIVVAPATRVGAVRAVVADLGDLLSQTAALRLVRDTTRNPVTIVGAGGPLDSSPLGLWQSFVEGNALEIVSSSDHGKSTRIYSIEEWLVPSVKGIAADATSDVGDANDAPILMPVCADAACLKRPFAQPAHRMRQTTTCCVDSAVGDPALLCSGNLSSPEAWPCPPTARRWCHATQPEGLVDKPWAACLLPWPAALLQRSVIVIVSPSEAVTPLYIHDTREPAAQSNFAQSPDRHSCGMGGCASSPGLHASHYIMSNQTLLVADAASGTSSGSQLSNSARFSASSGTTTVLVANNLRKVGPATHAELREVLCSHIVCEIAAAANMPWVEARALASRVCDRHTLQPALYPADMHMLERALEIARRAAARVALSRACAALGHERVVTPQHLDDTMRVAARLAAAADAFAESGEWIAASFAAQRALVLAHVAIADGDVVWSAHLPISHAAAIYAPPWAPLLAPVALGVTAALREAWRRRRHVKRGG